MTGGALTPSLWPLQLGRAGRGGAALTVFRYTVQTAAGHLPCTWDGAAAVRESLDRTGQLWCILVKQTAMIVS